MPANHRLPSDPMLDPPPECCDWCGDEFNHANREDDCELCRRCWEKFVRLIRKYDNAR